MSMDNSAFWKGLVEPSVEQAESKAEEVQAVFAGNIYLTYASLIKAGFTKEQAFQLTETYMMVLLERAS